MRNKRAYVIGGLSLAILTITASVLYALAVYPYIGFDRTIVDAGVVKEGQRIRVSFPLRNSSTRPAIIRGVTASCGAAALPVRGRTLAGGEVGEVEVRVNTSNLLGELNATAIVTLADPFERVVQLTVKGVVQREFLSRTKIVDFGTIPQDTVVLRKVQIQIENTNRHILTAHSTDESFTAHLEPGNDKNVATIIVTATPQKRSGFRFATIRIATSSPHAPELIIPVRAQVVPS